MAKKENVTHYSPEYPGEPANYNWPVRFDRGDDGFLGITQRAGDTIERVLLCPSQVRALRAFLFPVTVTEAKGRKR